MSIRNDMECVAYFQRKMGVSRDQFLPTLLNNDLIFIGQTLVDTSKDLEKEASSSDKRYLRAHLMLEELGETLIAMGKGDVVETLDGLADLLYVLLGTAVTFRLPLEEAFHEVHSSNMTKTPQASDPSRDRVRVKGPNYRPPNVKKYLQNYGEPHERALRKELRKADRV